MLSHTKQSRTTTAYPAPRPSGVTGVTGVTRVVGFSSVAGAALMMTLTGTGLLGATTHDKDPTDTQQTQAPADEQEPQSPTSDTQLFEELRVVGAAERLTAPGSAHVIDQGELERQQDHDLHRILRLVPGVNLQEEDGYGLRPNIGIRGTGVERSQKITLMEDGVPIAPAPYAAPSAYYVPTAARMEGVEVRKGSGAIRHGPHTNGGAINLLSTSIPGSLRARIRAAAGDDEEASLLGSVGDAGERWGYLFETYQHTTDGFKQLDDGGSTGFELSDYLGKVRVTSDTAARRYQALELKLGRTEQDGDETYLGLAGPDFRSTPYRRYAASAGDNIQADHDQLQLRYLVQPTRRLNLTATAYANDFFRNWFKLERIESTRIAAVLDAPDLHSDLLDALRGDVDTTGGALAVRNNRRDYTSRGAQAVLSWSVDAGRAHHDLDFGVRYHEDEEDRFQEEDLFDMVNGTRQLTSLGIPGSNANRVASARAIAWFAEDTIALGRLTLRPGVRVEQIDLERLDFGRSDPGRSGTSLSTRENSVTEVLPGLGVSWELGSGSTLFVGLHRGFSPPSPSSTQEVDSETSLNYEAGWRYRRESGGPRSLSAEVTGFWSDYDNLLGADTLSTGGDGTGDQFNGGAVTVRGLEAGLGVDLLESFDVRLRAPARLSYTYTLAEFDSSFDTSFADWAPRVEEGDALPYLPEHQLSLGVGLEADRWSLHLQTSYQDDVRTHAGQGPIPVDELIDDRWLLDVRAEVRVLAKLRLWARLVNATDEVYVAARRPAGLRPGRPRAALLGLSFDFVR